MTPIEKYIKTLETLHAVYLYCNERFYQNELQPLVITVHPDPRNSTYGWYVPRKIWRTEGDIEGYNEINLTSQTLNRPFLDVAETVLHEMAHQYADAHDIKDTSRNGRYHNKSYKRVAEAHGLTVEKDSSYGWSRTTLTPEAKAILEAFEPPSDGLMYDLRGGKGAAKSAAAQKSAFKVYTCPECGQSLKHQKKLDLLCGKCSLPFTVFDPALEETEEASSEA